MSPPSLTMTRLVAALLPLDSAFLLEIVRSAYEKYQQECKSTIPPALVDALVVAEDHRFYLHRGAEGLSILRAIWHSCWQQRLVGGSTIEQQLVRTLTGRKERSINRKIKELALSLCISDVVPKSDVPGLYLSVAYFGSGMNGIRDAYQRLGINHRLLTLRQAAELVARLKYPEPANPSYGRLSQIRCRSNYILRRLNSIAVADRVCVVGMVDDETVFCNR